MKYFILDNGNEQGAWEIEDPVLIGIKVEEVSKEKFNEFINEINSNLESIEVESDLESLPKTPTSDTVLQNSVEVLCDNYTKGHGRNIAKDLGIRGYSKFKEKDLWQFLKDEINKLQI